MEGKQLVFFLGPNDQIGFENALRTSGDIAFLRLWPATPKPEELHDSLVREMGSEVLDLIIARKKDLLGLQFTPVRGRNVFSCSVTIEPIIEFSRCYVSDDFIRSGRLYRVDQYWDQYGNIASKSDAFTAWAGRVFESARASLIKIERGFYAGTEAIELRKTGLKFEGLDVGVNSTAKPSGRSRR